MKTLIVGLLVAAGSVVVIVAGSTGKDRWPLTALGASLLLLALATSLRSDLLKLVAVAMSVGAAISMVAQRRRTLDR